MIVSASYKTDIPAFFGEWFVNRLRAGHCKMVNPYSRRIHRVDLRPGAAQAFVFWTKNAVPFLRHLPEIAERGFPFVFQYTINAYPRALETSVVDAARSVEAARSIRADFGPHALVWRYDTVIASSLTTAAFHRENFARLAASLEGATDEVVVSFLHVYRKTRRNLERAAREAGFRWADPPAREKRELARQFVEIAARHGMGVSLCSQPEYRVAGSRPARCVDAERLSRVAGRPIRARQRGNRPDCACSEARDIGEYDTCPHGCVYCYAVQHPALARRRFGALDPRAEFLCPPPAAAPGGPQTRRSS